MSPQVGRNPRNFGVQVRDPIDSSLVDRPVVCASQLLSVRNPDYVELSRRTLLGYVNVVSYDIDRIVDLLQVPSLQSPKRENLSTTGV